MKRRLPLGIQDFDKIREYGCIYIFNIPNVWLELPVGTADSRWEN
jgi:hypothetical protein